MKVVYSEKAWEDYQHWPGADIEAFRKLNALIAECLRSPFVGTGRPEPLKGNLSGFWSRRVNRNDRLAYRVSEKPPGQMLEIAQCRFHY
jgi:toxin YoeB